MTSPLDSVSTTYSPPPPQITAKQPSDNPISPQGRFTRMSYLAWLFIAGMVYTCALIIAFGFAAYALGTSGLGFLNFSPLLSTVSGWCATLILIISFIVYSYITICISIRRLHDINRSGWLLLLALIPLIGAIFILYLYFAKGDLDENKYGAFRATEQTEKVLGIIFSVFLVVYLFATIASSFILPNLLEQQLTSPSPTEQITDEESTDQVEIDHVPQQHIEETESVSEHPVHQPSADQVSEEEITNQDSMDESTTSTEANETDSTLTEDDEQPQQH